jgi:hypothetical protein
MNSRRFASQFCQKGEFCLRYATVTNIGGASTQQERYFGGKYEERLITVPTAKPAALDPKFAAAEHLLRERASGPGDDKVYYDLTDAWACITFG